MNISGLNLYTWAVLLKEELKKKPCLRCALRYDHKINEKCPDCGDLDSADLARLIDKKEREYQGRKSLGNWFFVIAIIIVLLMLVSLNV